MLFNMKLVFGTLPVLTDLSTRENAIAENNMPETKGEMFALTR
jgi:hypothetical protein